MERKLGLIGFDLFRCFDPVEGSIYSCGFDLFRYLTQLKILFIVASVFKICYVVIDSSLYYLSKNSKISL